MDAFIRACVARVTGVPADDFDWTESLTTAEEIARLLQPTPAGPPAADLVFLTDHVNETTTAFDADLIDLAIDEPRLAIGGELQTVVESPPGSGRFAEAPEILLYGTSDRVRARGGWHYGITAELLADMHRVCRPSAHPRVELHRGLEYCRRHGIAHALSHPLDGHGLPLSETIGAIAACRFIEAVNGGFGSDSTRRLMRYIALHNASDAAATVLGARVPPWVADGIVPWGGADAHLGNYARVRMLYRPPARAAQAGIADFVKDMVETAPARLLADGVFGIEGRGNGSAAVVAEVLRLVAANARRNRATFRGLRRSVRLGVLAPYLALRELASQRRRQIALARRLDEALDEVEARMGAMRADVEGAGEASPASAGASRALRADPLEGSVSAAAAP